MISCFRFFFFFHYKVCWTLLPRIVLIKYWKMKKSFCIHALEWNLLKKSCGKFRKNLMRKSEVIVEKLRKRWGSDSHLGWVVRQRSGVPVLLHQTLNQASFFQPCSALLPLAVPGVSFSKVSQDSTSKFACLL